MKHVTASIETIVRMMTEPPVVGEDYFPVIHWMMG
jgi:hypothetical protein